MSKVLVDRELLEQIVNTNMADYAVIAYQHKEIRSILARPAEAEGVDFGFDDRSVKVSQEAYSIFLERERHHLAALSAVTAERDAALASLERAYANYNQVSYASTERGKQIDQLRAEVEALRGRLIEQMTQGTPQNWSRGGGGMKPLGGGGGMKPLGGGGGIPSAGNFHKLSAAMAAKEA